MRLRKTNLRRRQARSCMAWAGLDFPAAWMFTRWPMHAEKVRKIGVKSPPEFKFLSLRKLKRHTPKAPWPHVEDRP